VVLCPVSRIGSRRRESRCQSVAGKLFCTRGVLRCAIRRSSLPSAERTRQPIDVPHEDGLSAHEGLGILHGDICLFGDLFAGQIVLLKYLREAGTCVPACARLIQLMRLPVASLLA
jgi:hypothetical protein